MMHDANREPGIESKQRSDVPGAAELLATARETLVDELLPALSGELRYRGLMVANALAIAAREVASGRDATRREIELLRPLAAQAVPPSDPGSDDLHALRRIVAAAIREGRFDDDAHAAALLAALDEIATRRLAISNPKALR
ncbi:MAG TPA: DUF6285 domain-containing protein [Casimicrobiaceae bacterium]|nr:DUF6285 domain-containing protein [Casimicrobiaceae bacterium]